MRYWKVGFFFSHHQEQKVLLQSGLLLQYSSALSLPTLFSCTCCDDPILPCFASIVLGLGCCGAPADLTELLWLCHLWQQIWHALSFFFYTVDWCSSTSLFRFLRSWTALFSVSDVFPECLVSFCAFRSQSIFRIPLSDPPTCETAVAIAAEVTVTSGCGLRKDSHERLQIIGELSFQRADTTHRRVCVISGRCDLHDFPLE